MSVDHVLFPNRFKALAEVYAVGRPTYPRLLAQRVAELLDLDGTQDVLDLGTGPGFPALDFEPFARAVTGIDPEPEMLRVARRSAERASVHINFVLGSSHDLSPAFGRFRLVTIGRAFHWMDRARTLQILDSLIEPGGGVALFSESYPPVAANAWHDAFERTVDSYATHDPARERLAAHKDHEAILQQSAFAHLERIAVLEPRRTTLNHMVDRALSFAKAWQGRAGSRRDDLAADVHAVLAPYAIDGAIDEVLEGTALIARRPAEI
ncbi:class I SAM-dependent methyltransferase [Reyranella sp. CPCC 100927]|uniref:class I SAM-dependent methyltransferase n=1 Tax=Reyranella sp. CPCC 100927 TaxID=2599616 RepID=UPI0015B3ED8A|nr:class I SAM-dependent methyltransferase [Reyranella sp. CPCC 100927]